MRRRSALLPLLLTLLVGCRDGGSEGAAPPTREETPVDPATLSAPDPDLSQLEPSLRAWMVEERLQVLELAARPGADPVLVASAFGRLGQFYQMYELRAAAVVCYEHAHRLDRGDYRWVYLPAFIHRHLGDLDLALARLEEALAIRPADGPALLLRGEVELELDQPEAACRSFAAAATDPDTEAEARYGLGRCLVATGDDEGALAEFDRVLELQPQATVVHYLRSQALRRRGRIEEAQKALELRGRTEPTHPDPAVKELLDLKALTAYEVVRLRLDDPGDLAPHELLSFALTHLGQLGGSVEALQAELLERKKVAGPENRDSRARLHYLIGGLLVFDGRDDEAEPHLATAVELAPEMADGWLKHGNVLARLGRLEEALVSFDRAIAEGAGGEARLKRGTTNLNLGRLDAARNDLEAALAGPDPPAEAHVRLAEVWEAAGRPERAEAALGAALALDLPEQALARIHRGYGTFLERQGRFAEAVEQHRSAFEGDRTLLSAQLRRARLLGHLGRFRESAEAYREVIKVKPSQEPARVGEAVSLILDRRLGEAATRLAEGAGTITDSTVLRHLLARLLAIAPDPEVRDGEAAIPLAEAVVAVDPRPEHRETLAMAYAAAGRSEEAVVAQERALTAYGASPPSSARARLALYRSSRAFVAGAPDDLLDPPPPIGE